MHMWITANNFKSPVKPITIFLLNVEIIQIEISFFDQLMLQEIGTTSQKSEIHA